jgi:hypothetical protein
VGACARFACLTTGAGCTHSAYLSFSNSFPAGHHNEYPRGHFTDGYGWNTRMGAIDIVPCNTASKTRVCIRSSMRSADRIPRKNLPLLIATLARTQPKGNTAKAVGRTSHPPSLKSLSPRVFLSRISSTGAMYRPPHSCLQHRRVPMTVALCGLPNMTHGGTATLVCRAARQVPGSNSRPPTPAATTPPKRAQAPVHNHNLHSL